MLRAIIALLLCATPALAQPRIAMHLGANAPLAGFSSEYGKSFLRNYWPVGFSLGAEAQLPLTRWMFFTPGIDYRLHPFNRFHQEVFAGSVATASSGQPLQQLALDMNLRILNPSDTSGVIPYFLLGGGHVFERRGRMIIQWDGQGEFSVTETGPEYREYWVYNIGIGMITRLSPQVLIEPSLLVRSNGEDRDYVLVNVSAVYLFTP